MDHCTDISRNGDSSGSEEAKKVKLLLNLYYMYY